MINAMNRGEHFKTAWADVDAAFSFLSEHHWAPHAQS